MSAFSKLKAVFGANWTTIFVGWRGLGVLSPWPDRWIEFPSLICASDVDDYAGERLLLSSNVADQDLISNLMVVEDKEANRLAVKAALEVLSKRDGGVEEVELRKWRLIFLDDCLRTLPDDAVYGPLALSEFWQTFGFPPDSPHEIQGRHNSISARDYYNDGSFQDILKRHLLWKEKEKSELTK